MLQFIFPLFCKVAVEVDDVPHILSVVDPVKLLVPFTANGDDPYEYMSAPFIEVEAIVVTEKPNI